MDNLSKELDRLLLEVHEDICEQGCDTESILEQNKAFKSRLEALIKSREQALVQRILEGAKRYVIKVNQSDDYEVDEYAVPIAKIKELSGE